MIKLFIKPPEVCEMLGISYERFRQIVREDYYQFATRCVIQIAPGCRFKINRSAFELWVKDCAFKTIETVRNLETARLKKKNKKSLEESAKATPIPVKTDVK